MVYYLNIGSNLGEREVCVRGAVRALEMAVGGVARCSEMVESEAWGYESENVYVNMGVAMECDVKPCDMLTITQCIERDMGSAVHRNADGGYCDRSVDIDIIAVDDVVMDSEALTIPHPRMHIRDFVLRPMMELAPEWVHPILQKTPSQLLAEL